MLKVIIIWMIERGLTAYDVVRQKGQFSGMKITRRELEKRIKRSPGVWRHCLELGQALDKGVWIPVSGFTHFYNPAAAGPAWATKLEDKTTVGNHVFGRLET
jgi:spore germination cell wall hydrolase CwlJ-like protein